MQPNYEKIASLYKSRKAIVINNAFAKLLGHDDMRDLFAEIHGWGHSYDFTYSNATDDLQRFLRLFIKDNYLS